jgi:Ankyrin repeat
MKLDVALLLLLSLILSINANDDVHYDDLADEEDDQVSIESRAALLIDAVKAANVEQMMNLIYGGGELAMSQHLSDVPLLLHAAVKIEDESKRNEIVARLMQLHPPPELESRDDDYLTPLHIAIKQYDLKLIDMLVRVGASVFATVPGHGTAMLYAKLLGYDDVVSKLRRVARAQHRGEDPNRIQLNVANNEVRN